MMIGPLMRTSPVSPSGTSLPSASTMRSSTTGTGGPTDVGLVEGVLAGDDRGDRAGLGEAVGVATCCCTLGNVSRTLRCSSSADGEPPKATAVTDEVS